MQECSQRWVTSRGRAFAQNAMPYVCLVWKQQVQFPWPSRMYLRCAFGWKVQTIFTAERTILMTCIGKLLFTLVVIKKKILLLLLFSRTPGGSSGGEGALIGACASVWGIGSDIAGSIRLPSAWCGLFGHKPTPEFLTRKGVRIYIPLTFSNEFKF